MKHWGRAAAWGVAVPLAVALTTGVQTCAAPPAVTATLVALAAGCLGLGATTPGRSGHMLLAAGLGCISLLPVGRALVEGGVPHAHDLPVHAWSIWSVARALEAGDLFPLWVDTLGVGSPGPGFYPPVPYLLGGLLVAAGLPVPTALQALAWGAGALGMGTTALVLRDQGLERGPVALGAAAFALAPYRLLDVSYRFALAELIGLTLILPCWYLALQVLRGRTGDVFRRPAVALAGFGTALVLCHPLSAITAAVGAVPLLFLGAVRGTRRGWTHVGAAVAAALVLTAFYTVPTTLDQSHTQVRQEIPEDAQAYAGRGLRLDQPLLRQRWHGLRLNLSIDEEEERRASGHGVREMPFYVGLCLTLPVLLVGLGARWMPELRPALPWVVVALWCWLATWHVAASVLGHVPVLRPLQFPWRFLGPASIAALPPLVWWLRPLLRGRAGAALLGAGVVALAWDAMPGLGAASWMEWPADAPLHRHALTTPSPTCDAERKQAGWAAHRLELDELVAAGMGHRAARPLPRHTDTPRDGPRISGARWAGYPSGDLPVRVHGLKLPPTAPDTDVALVYSYPREFWTEATDDRIRKPVRRRRTRGLRDAGVALMFQPSTTAVHRVAAWPRLRLRTADGQWWGVAGAVRRTRPSHLAIDLPPGHPAGLLVWVEQAFAGWRVRVDGERWSPAGDADGLLSVEIGADAARVELRYGATPARQAGTAVSLAGVLALALLAARRRWAGSPDLRVEPGPPG